MSLKPYLLAVSIAFSLSLQAQQVDYNKVVLPANIRAADFEEKLVQLAWQNMPASAILQNNKEISELQTRMAKLSWMNNIIARGNLNEFAINPEASPTGVNLFPRYNLGVIIPLGIFVSTPIETKVAKRQQLNTEQLINQQKLEVRKLVLTAYHNYRMHEEILKVKNDLVEDEYANMLVMEEKFQKREIPIEQYKEVTKAYNIEVEERIRVTNQLQVAKLELEALIGMRLEDVNFK